MKKLFYLIVCVSLFSCNGNKQYNGNYTEKTVSQPVNNANNTYYGNETNEHDFLATIFLNPEADYSNLYSSGLTKNNTTLQSADVYLNLPKIKNYFKSDADFYAFYNNVKIAYNYFITDNTNRRHLVEYPYSFDDIRAPTDALRGNAYQRNFCFANYPNRLQRLDPEYSGGSSSNEELENKNKELEDKIEELEKQLKQNQ